MTVQASLTEFDSRVVQSVRVSRCGCDPGVQLVGCELLMPAHLLDLDSLADLSDFPLPSQCPLCGEETVAVCHAAVFVPAEQALPSLAYVRPVEGASRYVLLARDLAVDASEMSFRRSLLDPESWLDVEPDEEWLIEHWGRPLSMHALVRTRIAEGLGGGQPVEILETSEGLSYAFTDRERAQDCLEYLAAWAHAAAGSGRLTTLPQMIEEGLGSAGSVVECLGAHSTYLVGSVGVFGFVETAALELGTRDALAACGFCVVGDEGEPRERILRVKRTGSSGAVEIARVGARAVLFGLTVAEAATLEVSRLALALDAEREAANTFADVLGKDACVELDGNQLNVIGPDKASSFKLELASLLPKASWDVSETFAREIVETVAASKTSKACGCGDAVPLAHLRPVGFAAWNGLSSTPITDDAGVEFELVPSLDCSHTIRWPQAKDAPTEIELEHGAQCARFRADAEAIGVGAIALAVVLTGDAIATMLAHPGLARRLARLRRTEAERPRPVCVGSHNRLDRGRLRSRRTSGRSRNPLERAPAGPSWPGALLHEGDLDERPRLRNAEAGLALQRSSGRSRDRPRRTSRLNQTRRPCGGGPREKSVGRGSEKATRKSCAPYERCMAIRLHRAEAELYEAAWLLQLSVNQCRYLVWTGTLENVGQARPVQIAVAERRRLLRGTDAERVLDLLARGELSAPHPRRRADAPTPLPRAPERAA